jgi:hypothetical protein
MTTEALLPPPRVRGLSVDTSLEAAEPVAKEEVATSQVLNSLRAMEVEQQKQAAEEVYMSEWAELNLDPNLPAEATNIDTLPESPPRFRTIRSSR